MKPYERVKWFINNSCNLNCSFCFVQNMKNKNDGIDKKFQILDKLYTDGVKYIDFFGKEPLLNEDIFKIMKYGESKNYDFYYTFISNGKNLRKYTPQIKNSPCKDFTISYDFHKGERDYHFNLIELLPFKDDFFIELSVDLYEGNISEILNEVEYIRDYGVTSLYFNPIMPIKGSDLTPLSSQSYQNFINAFLDEIGNKDIDVLFTFKIPFQMADLSEKYKNVSWCYTEPVCSAGKDHFCISSDGIAYGCVSQCAIGNNLNSCDYLKTPIGKVHQILSNHRGRLCI